MRVYILLDRSSSMTGRWKQTLEAINGYVDGLSDDTSVYLATFASSSWNGISEGDYQVIRNEPAGTFTHLTEDESRPHGSTPLLDSMAKLLDTAFEESPELAYIVVMTDGEENCSRLNTKQVIQEKLARAEDRNWEVIFLGSDFANVHDQSASVGLGYGKTLNISLENTAAELNNLSSHTMAYASTRGATRTVFTADDQARAEKK